MPILPTPAIKNTWAWAFATSTIDDSNVRTHPFNTSMSSSLAVFERLDRERTRNVQNVGGFLGRQFGMDWMMDTHRNALTQGRKPARLSKYVSALCLMI